MARPTPSFPCSTKEPYGSLESIRSLTPPAAAADIVLGGVSAIRDYLQLARVVQGMDPHIYLNVWEFVLGETSDIEPNIAAGFHRGGNVAIGQRLDTVIIAELLAVGSLSKQHPSQEIK
ncbi:hypothetical protein MPDQ_003058 [Monascus purpureus]|uniref:Uncharacterized protein n=1 Tax=Monascus purpureus TaxID=5098 RepID=A0A507R445_MONPU|nr:hypothetical protein MPDQ_003058 [Monascus purpureus]